METIAPKINNLKDTIRLIDKAIAKLKKDESDRIISRLDLNTLAETDRYIQIDGYLTISTIAELTGISRQTLYRWKRCGILKTTERLETKHLYSLSELRLSLLRTTLTNVLKD